MNEKNGLVSHWWHSLGRPRYRPSLPGDLEADVCVVGAGLTGLWTAYYLQEIDPSLRVVLVERNFAGFGASGRNGGWLTNSVTGGPAQYVSTHGREAAIRQQQAMNESVHEVIRVASLEAIESDIRHGGELIIARNAAQMARIKVELQEATNWPGSDWSELGRDDVRGRVRIENVLGGMWQPHCATLNPAKLVNGLACVVEERGATIFEGTTASQIARGLVRTDHGTVQARTVIRATEGFTSRIRGERRTWLPMNSSIIATEPLSPPVWDQLGWRQGEAVGDAAHMYIYAQRTADDRIAIGGRGVPYKFGSRFDEDGHTPQSTINTLCTILQSLFPALGKVDVAHAWSGVLGVPRDWSATVSYDHKSGVGYAGGYVGTGVTSTNLAGRTLADLILGRDTELTTLPWVNHGSRRWELEPLRWLGVQSIYAAYAAADRAESDGRSTTSRWARVAGVFSGHN